MQRDTYSHQPTSVAIQPAINDKSHSKKPLTAKLGLAIMTATMLSLAGCQTVTGLFGDDNEEAVTSASKSDSAYYKQAIKSMDKGNYTHAAEQLGELRTFYPTGPYAEQALLDLMYAQFKSENYELAATNAEKFIRLYPNNSQIDYAYYLRGVANMQAGGSTLLHIARLNLAHRDTAYMRLAFNNFQNLITKYPNSAYAPDAAQRMTYIYNLFAEHELAAARWYIKRDAYIASANRAKWVFQYYPLSEAVPEAIAILAYSNEKLGIKDSAMQYKTLLQINYPKWLNQDGSVKIKENHKTLGILDTLTFGKLWRSDKNSTAAVKPAKYNGKTKSQVIYQANQLKLPEADTQFSDNTSQSSLPTLDTRRRQINIGLGLPNENSNTPNAPITVTQPNTSATATVDPNLDSSNNADNLELLEIPQENTNDLNLPVE